MSECGFVVVFREYPSEKDISKSVCFRLIIPLLKLFCSIAPFVRLDMIFELMNIFESNEILESFPIIVSTVLR